MTSIEKVSGDTLPNHRVSLAFNLECTKCDISAGFEAGGAIEVGSLMDLAIKKHREVFPDCIGELSLFSQLFTAAAEKGGPR